MNETISVYGEFAKYGFMGLIIAVLGVYIWRTDRDRRKERNSIYQEHKEERNEWREQHSCQFKKLIEITDKHSTIISDFRVILKGIEKEIGK